MSNAQIVKNYIRQSEIKNNNTRNVSLRRAYNKIYGGMQRSDEEKKTSGWFDWIYPSYWMGQSEDEAAIKIQKRIRAIQARKRMLQAKRARSYADADERRRAADPFAAIARRRAERRAAQAARDISEGTSVSEKSKAYMKSTAKRKTKRKSKKKPARSRVAALASRFER